MSARAANPAEAMVSWTIRATWPFYAMGALYVVGPVFAWLLAGLSLLSLYLGPAMRPDLRPMGSIPAV
ncbi:MAG: O-antigen ligase domain-containing protein, partial [Pseudomonadota bacterium]